MGSPHRQLRFKSRREILRRRPVGGGLDSGREIQTAFCIVTRTELKPCNAKYDCLYHSFPPHWCTQSHAVLYNYQTESSVGQDLYLCYVLCPIFTGTMWVTNVTISQVQTPLEKHCSYTSTFTSPLSIDAVSISKTMLYPYSTLPNETNYTGKNTYFFQYNCIRTLGPDSIPAIRCVSGLRGQKGDPIPPRLSPCIFFLLTTFLCLFQPQGQMTVCYKI